MKPTKAYYVSDILRFHYCVFNYSPRLLVHLLAPGWICRLVAGSRQCLLLFVLVAFSWYLVKENFLLLTGFKLLPKVIPVVTAHTK